jgi:hypothetical protein
MGELMEMLGAASSQGIADLFDRVAAEGETVSALRRSALSVTTDVERQPIPRRRVFDPASTYFMMFQPFQQQVGPELAVELFDVDPVAIAPAFAGIAPEAAQDSGVPAIRPADHSSATETLEVGDASNASQEQLTAEPVIQQGIDRPRLDPAQHEVWGGPARVSALPSSPGDLVEVTMPPSHVLRPRVDLAKMLAQPSANDTAPDAEIARKLAMIRQDMNSFGLLGTGEGDRLRQHQPDSLYLYA